MANLKPFVLCSKVRRIADNLSSEFVGGERIAWQEARLPKKTAGYRSFQTARGGSAASPIVTTNIVKTSPSQRLCNGTHKTKAERRNSRGRDSTCSN
jgi:hypothetical protein